MDNSRPAAAALQQVLRAERSLHPAQTGVVDEVTRAHDEDLRREGVRLHEGLDLRVRDFLEARHGGKRGPGGGVDMLGGLDEGLAGAGGVDVELGVEEGVAVLDALGDAEGDGDGGGAAGGEEGEEVGGGGGDDEGLFGVAG